VLVGGCQSARSGNRWVEALVVRGRYGGSVHCASRRKRPGEVASLSAVGKKHAPVCDGYMMLRAEAAEFHEDPGQIEAHGNVSVTPLEHKGKRK
jgi:hypothetical protein